MRIKGILLLLLVLASIAILPIIQIWKEAKIILMVKQNLVLRKKRDKKKDSIAVLKIEIRKYRNVKYVEDIARDMFGLEFSTTLAQTIRKK